MVIAPTRRFPNAVCQHGTQPGVERPISLGSNGSSDGSQRTKILTQSSTVPSPQKGNAPLNDAQKQNGLTDSEDSPISIPFEATTRSPTSGAFTTQVASSSEDSEPSRGWPDVPALDACKALHRSPSPQPGPRVFRPQQHLSRSSLTLVSRSSAEQRLSGLSWKYSVENQAERSTRTFSDSESSETDLTMGFFNTCITSRHARPEIWAPIGADPPNLLDRKVRGLHLLASLPHAESLNSPTRRLKNDWTLVFQLSPDEFIHVELAVSRNMLLDLHCYLRDRLTTRRVARALAIHLTHPRPPSSRIFSIIENEQLNLYQFDADGNGKKHWVSIFLSVLVFYGLIEDEKVLPALNDLMSTWDWTGQLLPWESMNTDPPLEGRFYGRRSRNFNKL